MKQDMEIGEYAVFNKKTYRCVADDHSQMKRCILCDLNKYRMLCFFVHCQPDERDDRQAVIFRLTRKYRKEENHG